MPTALLGWELGAGTGHLQRFVPIVAQLLKRNIRVIAAMRDVGGAKALFQQARAGDRLSVVQAPIFLHRSKPQTHVRSLPEVFAHIGFADAELIAPVVSAWRHILATFKPDIVISDNAPSLNIAAKADDVHTTVIGNGWTIPPSIAPLPQLAWGALHERQSHAAEREVLEAVRKLTRDKTPFVKFAELLRGDANFPCTLATLDPYNAERKEPLYWPVEIATSSSPIQMNNTGYGVLYCPSSHPALQSVADALPRTGLSWRGYVPRPTSGVVPPLLRSQSEPIDFQHELPGAAVALHHGGLGTATWCIANRVPQVVMPRDLEKYLIGKAIEANGSGRSMGSDLSTQRLTRTIRAVAQLDVPEVDVAGLATFSAEETLAAIMAATGLE